MCRFIFFVLFTVMIAGGCATGDGKSDSVSRSTDSQMVLNQTWQWVATITPVERITVPNPERYTIRLTDDGKIQARFDCNGGGGNYEISAGRLSFGPLLSTRMACPPDSLDAPFMRHLSRARLLDRQLTSIKILLAEGTDQSLKEAHTRLAELDEQTGSITSQKHSHRRPGADLP